MWRTTPKPYFKQIFFGLCGKIFVEVEVVVVERDQELPLCVTKTAPGGFKTDMPLAQVEPIINFGGVSIITYLRKGKIYWAGAL